MTVYVTVIVVWKTDTEVGTGTVSVMIVVTQVYLLGDHVTVDTATVTYVQCDGLGSGGGVGGIETATVSTQYVSVGTWVL